MIFSFDVFDTCIIRKVPHPQDIFYIMQQALNDKKIDIPQYLQDNFAKIRAKSEYKARIINRGEIAIEDIYAVMHDEYQLTASGKQQLIQFETDLEIKTSSPIGWTLNEIKKLRKQRAKIIFASDMYLSSMVIQQMLKKNGIWEAGDNIYVSNEAGVTKGSGFLYDYITEKENCMLADLCHYGDNLYSDILVPFSKGMHIYKAKSADVAKLLQVCLWKYKLRNKFKNIVNGLAGLVTRVPK